MLGNVSLPVWKCGLKRMTVKVLDEDDNVTSCVEVWIETLYPAIIYKTHPVTSCVEVWIETSQ